MVLASRALSLTRERHEVLEAIAGSVIAKDYFISPLLTAFPSETFATLIRLRIDKFRKAF